MHFFLPFHAAPQPAQVRRDGRGQESADFRAGAHISQRYWLAIASRRKPTLCHDGSAFSPMASGDFISFSEWSKDGSTVLPRMTTLRLRRRRERRAAAMPRRRQRHLFHASTSLRWRRFRR